MAYHRKTNIKAWFLFGSFYVRSCTINKSCVLLQNKRNPFGMEKKQEELKHLTELVLGIKIRTPKDFELLQKEIQQKTGQQLSLSTLKRFWGYVDKDNVDYKVRVTTLDILAQFAGFHNWVSFCQTNLEEGDESGTMAYRNLYLSDLQVGTHIILRWIPDRIVTMRYEGDDLLTVVESIGSKLRPGDTCRRMHIVENTPLTLFSLVRNGELIGNYICGKEHGVVFSVRK